MNCNYLFIYGTLLRELRGNLFYSFEEYNQYLGKAWVYGKLYEIRNYPGFIKSHNKAEKVFGEVYHILDKNYLLDKIDEYEVFNPQHGDDQEYLRKQIYVMMEDNTRKRCWIYIYNKAIYHYEYIPSGDYVAYVREMNQLRRKRS